MGMTVYADAECDGCGKSESLEIFELATDDDTEAWQCELELPSGWTGDKGECFCGDCSPDNQDKPVEVDDEGRDDSFWEHLDILGA